MNFVKEVILICSMTLLAEGFDSQMPEVSVSCDVNALTVLVSFKKPFSGIIFAEGYYLNPFCSSSSHNINVQEAILSLPLFKCGTKFQKLENKFPIIKNTIQIQYHPLIKTIYDITENISCIYQWPIQEANDKKNLNQPKEMNPVIPYRSWFNFKLGSDVIGEQEAKKKGLSHKLFLVAYLQDGGKSKDFKVERCFAHDEYILNENTTVVEINPAGDCSDSHSLSEFTVTPNLPYSDLMAYAQVRAFNIKTRGELYITCGLQVCEQTCFRGCPEDHPHESNHWRSISTNRLFKRASDVSSKVKLRNLENRNVFLRSTVKALAKQFVELKAQLATQRNGTNFDKRVAKVLISPENTTQISNYNMNYSADTISLTKDFLFEDKPEVSTHEIAVVNQMLNFPSPTFESMKKEVAMINLQNSSSVGAAFQRQVNLLHRQPNSSLSSEYEGQKVASINPLNLLASDLGEQELPVMNQTRNSSALTSDFKKTLVVKTSEELSTTVATQNTTILLPSLYTDYFMTTGLPIYNRSTASYEPNSVYIITSDDALKQDVSSRNDLVDINATDSTEEFLKNSGSVQDCVPHFKFLVVTVSLGILSFSFFLICIGMWLYIRKERKRTALNSYLLYSFY